MQELRAKDVPANESMSDPLQAFEALLQEARPRLVRFARYQGIAPDAVEDVVQETLLNTGKSGM